MSKITFPRVLKAVFQLWDGEDRGSTQEELNAVEPHYNQVLNELKSDPVPFHPHNIASHVWRKMK